MRSPRVALVWVEPEGAGQRMMSDYASRRLCAQLRDAEVALIPANPGRCEETVAAIEAHEPDIVGGSAYVWSFAPLLDIGRELKRRRRDAHVVLGGPSARPAMFELAPYRARRADVDILVLGEGEEILPRIVASHREGMHALSSLPGLALSTADGFHLTTASSAIELDGLASAYSTDVASRDIGVLETYRGCPLGCTFCQWNAFGGNTRAFGPRAIAHDLERMSELSMREVQLIDAAVNLDVRAFRALMEAEAEVKVLERLALSFEVHPSHLAAEHRRFFERIRLGSIGVGIQSYQAAALSMMHRRQDAARCDEVVRQMAATGGCVYVELMMGVPGDSPEGFLRSLERALALPCDARVFHTLALPDALLMHTKTMDIRFDPISLRVESCIGWSAGEVAAMAERLDALATSRSGGAFPTWRFERRAWSKPRDEDLVVAPSDGTNGEWRLLGIERRVDCTLLRLGIERREDCTLLRLRVDGEEVVLELSIVRPGGKAFLTVGSLAVGYRGRPSDRVLLDLARVAPSLSMFHGR